MLITGNLQPKIVEKIVLKNGVVYRVCAEFLDIGGRIFGKIILVERVYELQKFKIYDSRFKNKTFYIIGEVLTGESSQGFDFGTETISPYFSLDFFISQMTRAPSMRV